MSASLANGQSPPLFDDISDSNSNSNANANTNSYRSSHSPPLPTSSSLAESTSSTSASVPGPGPAPVHVLGSSTSTTNSTATATGSTKWKRVFSMGKSKGKEREGAGLDGVFGDVPSSPTKGLMAASSQEGIKRPKGFERSLTEPSYFPPQPQHPTTPDSSIPPISTMTASTTAASSTSNVASSHSTSISGLTPLNNSTTDAAQPQQSSQIPSTSTSSGEQPRSYSVHTDATDRSSHSSSSRANGSQSHSQMAGSSASIYTTNSSHLPHRSPGVAGALGLGGFKARFFSNPSSGESLQVQSPESETPPNATSAAAAKKDKYKGLSALKGVGGGDGTNQQQPPPLPGKKSVGSSSTSSQQSPSHSLHGGNGGSSPKTPNKGKYRDKHIAPVSTHPNGNGSEKENSPSPQKGSAATRWLRRVVSAPNAKALFSPNSSTSTPPPVPPVPHSATANAHAHGHSQTYPPASPIIVVSSSSNTDGLNLVNTAPDGQNEADIGPNGDKGGDGQVSPTKYAQSTPSPHKPSIGSTLNPMGAVTRGQRAATVSSGTKAKDIQAQLGIGSGSNESHHKQVFRRTYSSNSIKTRSVSLPSRIKIRGIRTQ